MTGLDVSSPVSVNGVIQLFWKSFMFTPHSYENYLHLCVNATNTKNDVVSLSVYKSILFFVFFFGAECMKKTSNYMPNQISEMINSILTDQCMFAYLLFMDSLG